jgi:hypothetical protein
LKSCSEELVPVITSLINSSLVSGTFPDLLKEGRLIPNSNHQENQTKQRGL